MPSQWIEEAVALGVIQAATPIAHEQVQPNSLDLRLDASACRIHCSFLPGEEGLQKKLSRFNWYELPLSPDGTVLERNQVYLIPLMERLELPPTSPPARTPRARRGGWTYLRGW